MRILRSFLFLSWMLLVSLAMGAVFLPLLAGPRRAARWMAAGWARAILWGLRAICGVHSAVAGEAPAGPVLVAAKHMSMWDTLALFLLLKDPGIVLKRSLLFIPFFGWYVWKVAAIPIDRGGGADTLRRMTEAAKKVLAEGRPVLIFPEGTRGRPGDAPTYKPGVAGLYGLLKVPCVPVALDSGVYWRGVTKIPGTITLWVLEAIPPGLKRGPFMETLEGRIEAATKSLLEKDYPPRRAL